MPATTATVRTPATAVSCPRSLVTELRRVLTSASHSGRRAAAGSSTASLLACLDSHNLRQLSPDAARRSVASSTRSGSATAREQLEDTLGDLDAEAVEHSAGIELDDIDDDARHAVQTRLTKRSSRKFNLALPPHLLPEQAAQRQQQALGDARYTPRTPGGSPLPHWEQAIHVVIDVFGDRPRVMVSHSGAVAPSRVSSAYAAA